jgi:hypothetical protein
MRQFKFELHPTDGTAIFRGRSKTYGTEIFRGIAPNTNYTSCFDPCLPIPEQCIDFSKIPDAQRKESPAPDVLAKYANTVTAAQRQYNLRAEQVTNLLDCIDVLTSEASLPFHWFDDHITLQARVSEMDAEDYDHPNSEDYVRRDDFWDPVRAAALVTERRNTLAPFERDDIVVMRSPSVPPGEEDPQPFWMAVIIPDQGNPPHWSEVDTATETDTLVHIHWYDRSRRCSNVEWQEARWVLQFFDDMTPFTQWVCKSTIYMALQGLTARCRIFNRDLPKIQLFLNNRDDPNFQVNHEA